MSNANSTNIQLEPGDTLFIEGDESNSIYVLGQGSLTMLRNAQTLGKVDQRGDPFGFAEAALGIPRQSTFKASEKSRLKKYNLTGDKIYEWLEDHPLTGFRVMRNNARLLDFLNRDNKNLFDQFRDARNSFEPFLSPFREFLSALPTKNSSTHSERIQKVRQLLEDSFVGQFAKNYRSIINATGRSVKQAPSDLSVPEDVQKDFPSSSTICDEGREEDCFYLLLEGTLSVHKEGQRVATIDEPGSIFGEMSALLSGQRTATIISETFSRVAVFPYEKLRSLFEESPSLARTILKTFLKRLQRAVRLNENLTEFMDRLRKIRNQGGLPDDTRDLIEKCLKIIRSEADGGDLLNQTREIEDKLKSGFDFEREI